MNLWRVGFVAEMKNFEKICPVMIGELHVWGDNIFEVLEFAREKLNSFGFDKITINGAHKLEKEVEE